MSQDGEELAEHGQRNDAQITLSYRQNRRLEQAKRAEAGATGRTRGPTRGVRSRRLRQKNPGDKPYAKISEPMRRIVGSRAAEFISDCSRWVREFCPLNSRNWTRMDKNAKERLFDKIKGEWNLPKTIGGTTVKVVLNSQCAALFRGWRYRLKEENFVNFTREEARRKKPDYIDRTKWNWLVDDFWSDPKQKRISETNRMNKLKQTIKHSNGAKSTARILEELMDAPQLQHNQGDENEGSPESLAEQDVEPVYVQLYDKTHRHIDHTMEPEAEANLEALKKLHQEELQKHGEDNLTPAEAFPRVLKEKVGYIRGLGAGPKPPKKRSNERESLELMEEMQRLQQVNAEREAALNRELEEMRASNTSLREEVQQITQASTERDKRIRDEIMAEVMATLRSSGVVN